MTPQGWTPVREPVGCCHEWSGDRNSRRDTGGKPARRNCDPDRDRRNPVVFSCSFWDLRQPHPLVCVPCTWSSGPHHGSSTRHAGKVGNRRDLIGGRKLHCRRRLLGSPAPALRAGGPMDVKLFTQSGRPISLCVWPARPSAQFTGGPGTRDFIDLGEIVINAVAPPVAFIRQHHAGLRPCEGSPCMALIPHDNLQQVLLQQTESRSNGTWHVLASRPQPFVKTGPRLGRSSVPCEVLEIDREDVAARLHE